MDLTNERIRHRLHLSLHALEAPHPSPSAQEDFVSALRMCRDYGVSRDVILEDLWHFRSHPVVGRVVLSDVADQMFEAYGAFQRTLRPQADREAPRTAPRRAAANKKPTAPRDQLRAAIVVGELAERVLSVVERVDSLPTFDDDAQRAERDVLALEVADCLAEANAVRYQLGDRSITLATLLGDAAQVKWRAQLVDPSREAYTEALERSRERLSELGINEGTIPRQPVASLSPDRIARIIYNTARNEPKPKIDPPTR